METESENWRSKLRKAVGTQGLQPGGVTVTLIDDTKDKLMKVSREGLEYERKCKSVICKNIWQELAK